MWNTAIYVAVPACVFAVAAWLVCVWVTRVLGFLVAGVLQYKYNLPITIGQITIYMALRDVSIKTKYFWVYIDKISCRSSLFNKHAPKLLTLNIVTVRVYCIQNKAKDISSNSLRKSNLSNHERKKLKAPDSISNLVQFLGIYITEVLVWGWEKIDEDRGLHFNAKISDISVDGCTTVGEATPAACIVVKSKRIDSRVCENWLPNEDDLSDPMSSPLFDISCHPDLKSLHWTFDLRLNIIFSPRNSGEFMDNFCIDIENLFIGWEQKEKFMTSFHKVFQNRSQSQEAKLPVSSGLTSIEKIEYLIFTQCVPKEVKFRIFETQCEIKDDLSSDFISNVSGFSFTSKCILVPVNDVDMVTFESQIDLGLIRIEPDHHQSFSVDQFSNYFKLANHNVTLDFDISNLSLKYNTKSLLFEKSKFKSNLILVQQFPGGEFKLREMLQSVQRVTFESSQLDMQYNEKTGSFTSAFIEVSCKDLNNVWADDSLTGEVIIKSLKTEMDYMEEVKLRPLGFDALHFYLRGEEVGVELSGSQFQWVPRLEAMLLALLPAPTKQLPTRASKNRTNAGEADKQLAGFLKGVNIKIRDSKMLYMAENKLCLNVDLGAISASTTRERRNVKIERFEVFSSSDFSDCTLNPLFNIPNCHYVSQLEGSNKHTQHEFTMKSDTAVCWSPLLHTQLMQFFNKLKVLRNRFKIRKGSDKDNATGTRTIIVRFKKCFTLTGKLSKVHAFEISADNWAIQKGYNNFEWTSDNIKLKFDGLQVGELDNFLLARSPKYFGLTRNNRKVAGLSLAENTVWFVDADYLSFTFPFGYNFASAFNEEFITCFKWLKKQHPPSMTAHPALWSDLSIKFRHVRIEVGDDPFEVKLRDNYELLEDEYFENQKRLQVLDTKISQIYKSNLLMSSHKIEELKKQLQERSSSIYIQRSKKLYQNHARRTHLLLWELEEVQITTMADPLMFGPENLKPILQELDPESPWPAEGLEFVTLWCRYVRFDINKWRVQLRDFPQPLMDSKNIHFWGKLAAAEAIAPKRALRTCEIEIGGPFDTDFVERSLNGLKWYFDMNCDVDGLSVAFGPCWEPVLAQCNLAFENIFSPPRDPSRPLPFWDKIRLLFHGRLYTAVNTLTHLLHASLNPYNTTEEMEVTWTDVAIAWTNGKILFDGDLNIYVRTASKYDDCRMIHLPNIRLAFKLNWVCLADSNDHHAVQPYAPDKLPEYSSNQEHDSYRAFRSQHLNMNISLDTKSGRGNSPTCPTAVLYGSTLRWFENLKLILSGTTRPTRRGVLFRNTRPRKVPISRHYKKIRLSISLNRFHICYWVSFSMQSGIELNCGKLSSCSEHQLALQPISDGLIHRPKADWSVLYVNTELNETEIWLQAAASHEGSTMTLNKPIEKFFFMSIDKLSYGRESLLGIMETADGNKTETPQHRLVVHELKGAWTKNNRDVAFALLDSFVKVQQLRKNLSTEALKSFFSKHDAPTSSPLKKNDSSDSKKGRQSDVTSPTGSSQGQRSQLGASPLSGLQGQNAASSSLLQKLISEADSRGVVFSEDLTAPPPQQSLHGLAQSSLDDVIHQKWLIELVNCQVLLKGCETGGYVIVSAAKAHILQREHKPVWKHGTIVPKTTWVGSLEGMQYYATVSVGINDNTPDENIQWVSVENIEERVSTTISNVPDMVGSGQSVGGVVSETVGATSDETAGSIQLQRIISRCKCEFFYTTYGETGVDKIPSGIPDIPPAPRDLELWDETNKPVEAFTLMHHDLNIFTNSLQYNMIMDIVNNLVLYVDPKRKEAFEKLQRLRFKLQLQSTEAQRKPIQQLQNHLRSLVNQQRRLEKETYAIHKSQLDDPNSEPLRLQRSSLEQQVNESKELVAAKGEELHMMIMCYKETKLAATQRLSRKRDNKDVSLVRVYEICFKHAKWRLTQTDGQLGIADLSISNFLYTKTAKSDDSIEHLSELGYITVTNLLPNQVYKDVLVPSHIHASMPVDRQRTMRVFCRDRPPVGGIAVKEHFEINISPITIGMTYQFFKTLFKFCFPEKDPEKLDEVDPNAPIDPETASLGGNGGTLSSGSNSVDSPQSSLTLSSMASVSTMSLPTPSKTKRIRNRKKESKFYVAMSEKDDVEKMKERAEKNMLFICVKIPEVPVRVSYKGEKEKNIEDVHDVHLIIPTLEYNNITWTWLDFLVAVRNHSKRVLLSQAIKQKLQIWPKAWSDNAAGPQEEDKAKMLLGLSSGETKKKYLFGSKK